MAFNIKNPPYKTLKNEPPNLFLAGSIEQNSASQWQDDVIKRFQIKRPFCSWVIYNPRRDNWNAEWEQSINDPNFLEQVYWELDGIEAVDHVFMYFDPNTKSPISLLELGLCAGLKKNIVVCCPEGFYRKGNVDIVCQKYNIPMFDNLDAAISYCLIKWKLD